MNTVPSSAGGLPGPGQATAEEVAAFVVAAAVWAPSVHNTQPWWFSARGQEISLYADAGRQLMVADPGGREMMISCGAALFTAPAREGRAGHGQRAAPARQRLVPGRRRTSRRRP
jgi:nitroreductase